MIYKTLIALALAVTTSTSQAAMYNFNGEMNWYDQSGVHVPGFSVGDVTGYIDTSGASGYGYFESDSDFIPGTPWGRAEIIDLFIYDSSVGGIQEFDWRVETRSPVISDLNNNIIETRSCHRTLSYDGCANILQPGEAFYVTNDGVVLDPDSRPAVYYHHIFNLSDSNQFAGGIFWDWNTSGDILSMQVWERVNNPDGTMSLVSLDGDSDGAPGYKMLEGPFLGHTMALDGQLSQVPIPAALWLFGSGLIGLISIVRRKKS